MSRLRAAPLVLLTIALLWSPASSPAHGGEDEALEKTPARALAQQALALLAQQDKAVEAHERVEAALKSKDAKGVDRASLLETQKAFDRGDHDRARVLLNQALAPKPERKERMTGEAKGHAGDGEGAGAGAAAIDEGALDHTREYDPGRDAGEWIALALGLGTLLAAGLLLLRHRPPRRA